MPQNDGEGPWGGKKNGDGGSPWGQQRPNQPGQGGRRPADIDDMVRKSQERLRVLMGGGGGGNSEQPRSGGGSGGLFIFVIAAILLWLFASVYTVQQQEQSVELFLGKYSTTKGEGLHFAPWPVVKRYIITTTTQRTENIGVGGSGRTEQGLMLTGDENIVDVDFQIVWNISDPEKFLFTLRDPKETVAAVSESAIREVVGRSQLAPILTTGRNAIAAEVESLVQNTLDSYNSGINIIRVNFNDADPPEETISAFREVQAAEQERVTLQNRADKYRNTVVAEARGNAAKMVEAAEAYRAQVVNDAQGSASRFESVYEEYQKAPEVTRKRLYLETIEKVLGDVDKVIIDPSAEGGQGVVPYLPLNELRKSTNEGGQQ